MNTILGSENIVFSINILCKTCECPPRIWSWKIVNMSWKSHGFLGLCLFPKKNILIPNVAEKIF